MKPRENPGTITAFSDLEELVGENVTVNRVIRRGLGSSEFDVQEDEPQISGTLHKQDDVFWVIPEQGTRGMIDQENFNARAPYLT